MGRATEDKLDTLHGELAEVLTKAIQPEPVILDGQVVGHKLNAAALNVARQFLKDNSIEGPAKGSVKELAKSLLAPLPFAEGDSDQPTAH
jgi:hypothetical protein